MPGATGLLHVRVSFIVPPPHVTVHAVLATHADHPPSAAVLGNTGMHFRQGIDGG
jgi:hypothetical protein